MTLKELELIMKVINDALDSKHMIESRLNALLEAERLVKREIKLKTIDPRK